MKPFLLYGQLALPLAIIGLPLYIYLPKYYVDELGVNIALVGVVLFIARLIDVVTDPYIGYISDKTLKKYSTRKPLVLIGAVLILLSFYQLLNPLQGYEVYWLFIFSVTIYIGWGFVNIVYLTWSSEIYTDNNKIAKLNLFREFFSILGLMLAILIPFSLGVSSDTYLSLQSIFIFFVFIFLFSIILVFKYMKIQNYTDTARVTFKDIKKLYLDYRFLPKLQLTYFFNNLANAIPATLFLFFVEFILEDKDKTGILLLVYFISGIVALPFWNKVYKIIGEKRTWMLSMFLSSSAFLIVPFLQAGDFKIFLIVCIVSGFSVAIDLALPVSIQGEFIRRNNKSFQKISGLLFGVLTMLTKLALASAVGLTFIILNMVGFKQDAPSPLSLEYLSLLYGVVPIVLKVVSIYTLKRIK